MRRYGPPRNNITLKTLIMQVSYPQAETTEKPPKIIVILGPTASGKSELAVKIAKHLSDQSRIKTNKSRIFENNSRSDIRDSLEKFTGAEIISADSRQVYRGLDIGSGKVPNDLSNYHRIISNEFRIFERDLRKSIRAKFKKKHKNYFYKGVRHHLLDVASPKRTFTVVQYQKLAKKALRDIIKRGKIPIICGGTGLYIDSLIHDYKFPEVPPQPKLRKKLEKLSTEDLFKKLQKLDSRRAKHIDKHNRRRLIRALEIIITTKKPTSPLIREKFDKIREGFEKNSILKLGVKQSAEELKKLIRKRLMERLKSGMIDEVKNLHEKQKLNWQRLDDLGMEYRYISRYLRGLITYDKMKESIQKESEKYAKRQITWFKRDKEITWIDNPKEAYAIYRDWLSL